MLAYELLPCTAPAEKEHLPIVALHGMLRDKESFKPFCNRLTSFASVYVVDLPAHGASPTAKPLTVVSMAEMLLSFLPTLRISRCVLLGHSLGGQVCMSAALGDKNGMIAAVCVLDISPVNYFTQPSPLPKVVGELDIVQLFAQLISIDLRTTSTKSCAIGFLQGSYPAIPPERAESALYLLKEKNEGGPLEWHMDVKGLHEGLESKELCWGALGGEDARFEGPLVVLRGSDSPWVCEKRHKEQIDRYFPDNCIVIIDHAGHSPQDDCPAKVADTLKAHLQPFVKQST